MSKTKTDSSGRIVKQDTEGGDIQKREVSVADMLPRYEKDFAMVLPKHLPADRFMRLALSAIRKTPKLGTCSAPTFFGCLLQCAQLGLEPNTPLDHAYLIPRWNGKDKVMECTLQVGYKGYLQLALNAGVAVRAHVVREGDEFDYGYGLDATLTHRVSKDPKRSDQPITHAYAVATLPGGEKVFEVLDKGEIMLRKAMSDGANSSYSPWNTALGMKRMYEKSAVRALVAWIPKSAEQMQRAVALDDASDGQRLLTSAVDDRVLESLQGHGLSLPAEGELVEVTQALPANSASVDQEALRAAVNGGDGLRFNGAVVRELAGQPVSNAKLEARVNYLTALDQRIRDEEQNQPDGWQARAASMKKHQAEVQAEHEALKADGQ